jgi:flagellar hook-basal body complex protein FliE
MNFQRISPLWETFPGREAQPAAAAKAAEGSVFADVFQSLVNNVRETEDEVAKKEYLLSTGQLDNPATLNMALYKAEVATQLFVQVREKALNAYSELNRISL